MQISSNLNQPFGRAHITQHPSPGQCCSHTNYGSSISSCSLTSLQMHTGCSFPWDPPFFSCSLCFSKIHCGSGHSGPWMWPKVFHVGLRRDTAHAEGEPLSASSLGVSSATRCVLSLNPVSLVGYVAHGTASGGVVE